MPSRPTDRAVLVLARDLVFRAKVEAVVQAAGFQSRRQGAGVLAIVELAGPASLAEVQALVGQGIPVLAFGPHLDAELLRAARRAGAQAVPNSELEATLRRRLAELG